MSSFVCTVRWYAHSYVAVSTAGSVSHSYRVPLLPPRAPIALPHSICFIEQVRPTLRPCFRGKTATETWEKEPPIVSPTCVYLPHNVLHSPSLFSMHGNLDFFFFPKVQQFNNNQILWVQWLPVKTDFLGCGCPSTETDFKLHYCVSVHECVALSCYHYSKATPIKFFAVLIKFLGINEKF